MKELFDEAGHLTDYAFNCLINDELDELTRLEISEHMSFCDDCLLRYMNILDSQQLIEPPELLEKSIMSKLKARTIRVLMNQYTQMAIAASFALVFWVSGVFNPMNYDVKAITSVSSGLTETTSEFEENISQGLNKIISIDLKGVKLYEKK
jgi:hypothetical protein